MFDDPYDGEDDRKTHILRQNERMDDQHRFKRKYHRRTPASEDRRTKKYKTPKPVDPRIAALDGYTAKELRAAMLRAIARERTPEELRTIEDKRVAALHRHQATCDHTKFPPRRVKRKGPNKGKLQCPSCFSILPEEGRQGSGLKVVT
jgi:hypothetical protein